MQNTLRIYLRPSWKEAAGNLADESGSHLGEYTVRNAGTRKFIEIVDTWIVSMPEWAQRLGEDFTLHAYSFTPLTEVVLRHGTATGAVKYDGWVSDDRNLWKIMVAGTRVQEVIELCVVLLGYNRGLVTMASSSRRHSLAWMSGRRIRQTPYHS